MVSNDDVARAWANHEKLRSKNLYTDGKSIWSYGTHFYIAMHIGGDRALFNTDKYSLSTSQHQSLVSYIGCHLKFIECDTREINTALMFPGEPIVIEREIQPTMLSTILNALKEFCKSKGVKRFPMKKTTEHFEKMIVVEQI